MQKIGPEGEAKKKDEEEKEKLQKQRVEQMNEEKIINEIMQENNRN